MLGWLTHAPPDPTLLQVGGLTVHWYGALMAAALLTGVLVAQRLAKRIGISAERVVDIAFVTTVAAILGARLVHVLNDWSLYAAQPVNALKFWEGGLAFHGVLLGGLLALWGSTRHWKIPLLSFLDVSVPALAAGQVIGRWGNWFNQELYGRPSSLPWAIPIDPSHRVPSVMSVERFHPLFLYEALGNAVIFVLLWLLWRWPLHTSGQAATRGRRVGDVTAVYFALSPALRFGLDFLRLDQPMWGPLTNAQWFSLVLITAGFGIFFRSRFSSNTSRI